ncbi:MAG: VOC family protein [Pseudomonadota bacterium]|nr:VOC family protein [Pseudomonadota bacterium]
MSIDNVLASVAVKDLEAASAWYAKLFGHPATTPMAEVAEWRFPRGGCLQVYQLPERAGRGSFTVAVSDIEAETRKLVAMGLDTSQRASSSRVKTVMVTDPDGNHIAFAEATDPTLAR